MSWSGRSWKISSGNRQSGASLCRRTSTQFCRLLMIWTRILMSPGSILITDNLDLGCAVIEKVTSEKEFVEQVMAPVELDNLRHALVGLPGSTGLSTEQRKRLTIAVELVSNPSIIFMDEPTSGLDARAAAIVMRTVRNTVDTGRTVICTIHQPSIDIFEAFDELLLMKRGGRVIYGGALGTNSEIMIDYFQGILGIPPIPDGYNPATWMLEISTPASEKKLDIDFATIYKNSDQFREVEALIHRLSRPVNGTEPLRFSSNFSQDTVSQFRICYWKQNLLYWRSPKYNAVRLFFTTISAFILGSVFWNVGLRRETNQDLFVIMGALYSACLFPGVNNASSVQPIISIERTIFYREKAARMYSSFPYAAAQENSYLPGLHVPHFHIFHILWYNGNRIDSYTAPSCSHFINMLFFMESVFWLSYSKA